MTKASKQLRFFELTILFFLTSCGTTKTKREVSITAGDTLRLHCTINSNGPLLWTYPDGLKTSSRLKVNPSKKVVRSNGISVRASELVVHSSTIDDSGAYGCQQMPGSQRTSENNSAAVILPNGVHHGVIASQFYVYVFDGVNLITNTPSRLIVTEGTRLVIPCRRTTKTTSGLELRRVPSTSKVPDDISYFRDVGFVIEYASRLEDKGIWKCLARNENLTTIRTMLVNIKPAETATIGSIEIHAIPSKEVLANGSVRVRCEAEYRLDYRMKFVWSKSPNKAQIKSTRHGRSDTWYDQRKKAKREHGIWWEEIEISQVKASDSGMYNCTVIGANKKQVFVEIQVFHQSFFKILTTPEFERIVVQNDTMNSITVAKGYRTVLSFSINAIPRPNILLLHDGKSAIGMEESSILTKAEHGSVLCLDLILNQTKPSDKGVYTIIFTNLVTTHNITFLVNVQDPSPPSIFDSENLLESIRTIVGRDLKLKCDAFGAPTPIVRWYRGSELIHNGSTYYLTRVTEKEEGNYTCVARNKLGQSYRSVQIQIKDPERDNKIVFTVVSCILVALLSYLGVIIFMKMRKVKEINQKLKLAQRYLIPIIDPRAMTVEEQSKKLAYDPKQWEIPRDRLRLGKTIGRGAFGRVVQAIAFDVEKSQACSTVAVKMLKAGSRTNEYQALMSELRILIHLGRHLNIVNFFGACTTRDGPLMIIVEYCRHGNLSNYLRLMRDRYVENTRKPRAEIDSDVTERKRSAAEDGDVTDIASVSEESAFVDCADESRSQHRWSDSGKRRSTSSSLSIATNSVIGREDDEIVLHPKSRLSSSCSVGSGRESIKNGNVHDDDNDLEEKSVLREADLLSYSLQVARGMEFLSSKMCIHRDLAARNILVSDYQIVKICDFGLARDVYQDPDYIRSGEGRLPLKWMALESIFEKVYSTKSDVWSFGVLLWEIFSLGGSPYPGIQMNEDFCEKLRQGFRMKKPRYASDQIYGIMLASWADEPDERPSFTGLAEELSDTLQNECENEYLDMLKIFQKAESNSTRGVNQAKYPTNTFEEIIPTAIGGRQVHVATVEYTDIDGMCAALMNQSIRRGSSKVKQIPVHATSARGEDWSPVEDAHKRHSGADGPSIHSSSGSNSGTSASESPPAYATVIEVTR